MRQHNTEGTTVKNILARLHYQRNGLRSDRGATDPLLIIAGIVITLVLIIGGTFLISEVTSNAKDLNASADLDKISVSEAGAYAQGDNFLAYGSFGTSASRDLENQSIGFRPTDGSSVVVSLAPAGADWAAASLSQSNEKPIFIRTSESNKTVKYTNAGVYAGSATAAADLAAIGLTADDVTALVTLVKAEK